MNIYSIQTLVLEKEKLHWQMVKLTNDPELMKTFSDEDKRKREEQYRATIADLEQAIQILLQKEVSK